MVDDNAKTGMDAKGIPGNLVPLVPIVPEPKALAELCNDRSRPSADLSKPPAPRPANTLSGWHFERHRPKSILHRSRDRKGAL